MSLETNHGMQTSLIYLVQNNFLKTLFGFEDFCLPGYNAVMDWIHLAHDRDQWKAVVNTMINLS
jgi:hypothetical protein